MDKMKAIDLSLSIGDSHADKVKLIPMHLLPGEG